MIKNKDEFMWLHEFDPNNQEHKKWSEEGGLLINIDVLKKILDLDKDNR